MQLFFILACLMGFMYFGFKKRHFDLYSLGFISSVIYFLPGFFGYSQYPTRIITVKRQVPLLDETYLVMIFVLIIFLVAAIIYDYFISKPPIKNIVFKGSSYVTVIFVAIGVIGFLLTVMTVGDTLLSSKKSLYMDEFERTRWQLIWGIGCSLGMVCAYVEKKWKLLLIPLSLLLFNFYIGVRSNFALTIIAIFLIFIQEKGKMVLCGINNLQKYKIQIIFFSLMAYSFFLYKKVYQYVKLGMWDNLMILVSQPDLYIGAITDSEPFYIQTILNEVISKDYHVGLTYFFRNIMSQLFLVSSLLKTKDFNTTFQPELFSYWQAGLGANIWAETWSAGGWLFLFIFTFFLMVFLGFCSYWLRTSNPILKGGLALLCTYWSFYIHRNDIFNQLSYTKQIVLLWVFVVVICMAIPIKRIKKYNNY